MTVDDVRKLYEYQEWATARLLGVIRELDEGTLTAPIESSFPSILGTFAHIVASEWIWLRRWEGESPSQAPRWTVDTALGRLERELTEVESRRTRFLLGLTETDLQTTLHYRKLDGNAFENRLLDLLLHVVNHSTYHRGQLVTMLRQVGVKPVATDYVLFARVG